MTSRGAPDEAADLYLHNLDFHYHAGQERQAGASLNDYVDHARQTGRRVLGLTDHINIYIPPAPDRTRTLYPRSEDGLLAYYHDIDCARSRFPDLTLLFAPEIPPRMQFRDVPDSILAVSDYFICETPSPVSGDGSDRTGLIIERVHEIAAFSSRTSKPVFVAHPFRSSVNSRLIKCPIEPWITQLPPREQADFSREELNRFFYFQIERVARECKACGVPVEINGNTHQRVLSVNLQSSMQMLRAGYRLFLDAGCDLVPGSDLHGIGTGVGRGGGGVPVDTFEFLGLGVSDIRFMDPFASL